MTRALPHALAFLTLVLVATAPMAGFAQQLPGSTDSAFDHALIHFNLGSLNTSWRSIGQERWQLKTKAGAWVDFPPEGTELAYFRGGSGPDSGTEVVLRVSRDRQGEIMAYAKSIATAFANARLATKRIKDHPSGNAVSVAVVGDRRGGGLGPALHSAGFVPTPMFNGADGTWCPNDHFTMQVPLARLDDVFKVLRAFPAPNLGPCKF